MNHRNLMKKLLENFSDAEIMKLYGSHYFHRVFAERYVYQGVEFADGYGKIYTTPLFSSVVEDYLEVHKKIKIGDIGINAPFRHTPDAGTRYYFFLQSMDSVGTCKWSNDTVDHKFLACGNCFRSEDDANAARNAIIKLLSGEQ